MSDTQPITSTVFDRHSRDAVSGLVTNGSIEISATPLERVESAAALLPYGTSVYVPSPAKRSLASNLPHIAALHQAGMEAVPHIAARKIASRDQLKKFLVTVVRDYGVHRVLVIGGDGDSAAGPYADSISLLRDEILAETGIHEVGVAGYPEGHPRIPLQAISDDLDEKVELANNLGMGLEVITQFSFAPMRIVEYCAALSHRAPRLPVYVGIAGPTSRAKLLRYAQYCGVSASVRALSELGLEAVKGVSHTNPDRQVTALAQYRTNRESCNVIGVHVFGFGGFERSARWMRNKVRQDTGQNIPANQ
jgi:methylenetetrahydrofolate reductase (NADPH)